jgi:hypothetical protein
MRRYHVLTSQVEATMKRATILLFFIRQSSPDGYLRPGSFCPTRRRIQDQVKAVVGYVFPNLAPGHYKHVDSISMGRAAGGDRRKDCACPRSCCEAGSYRSHWHPAPRDRSRGSGIITIAESPTHRCHDTGGRLPTSLPTKRSTNSPTRN